MLFISIVKMIQITAAHFVVYADCRLDAKL